MECSFNLLEKYQRYEVVVDTWNYVGRGQKTVSYFATTLQDGKREVVLGFFLICKLIQIFIEHILQMFVYICMCFARI